MSLKFTAVSLGPQNLFCDDRESKQGTFHCEGERTSLVFKTLSAVRTFWYSELKRVCTPRAAVYPHTLSPCRVYSSALDFLWLSHRESVVEL